MPSTNTIDADRRKQVDGAELTAQIGVDDEEILWRKDFTNFEREDRRRLDAMSETMEPVIDEMVDDFYDHLDLFDETVEIFGRSTKTGEQLKGNQRAYLRALFGGSYDRQYFESRARIGKIHDMLDLGPKIYLGAYSIFYEHIIETQVSELKSQLAATEESVESTSNGHSVQQEGALAADDALDALGDRILSVLKLMSLDQQIAMDTYINSYSRDLETELDRQQAVSTQVKRSTAEAKQAGEEITDSATEISDVAASQAESMDQVASEVSNMSATVEEIASTADEVATQSRQANELAQEGTAAADEAISVMESVADSSQEVVEDMDSLQSRIDDIDEVVEVINDIAGQTNLLALNASIEAARAGEAGSGFAVVADEVKSLAEESQTHAKDIEELVDEIKEDATETVDSLEATAEEVDTGISQVESAMAKLDEIADEIQQATQGIEEVSTATDDQAASSEEVATMVTELVDQANEIADEVKEIAAANEQQTEQIKEIEDSVGQLV